MTVVIGLAAWYAGLPGRPGLNDLVALNTSTHPFNTILVLEWREDLLEKSVFWQRWMATLWVENRYREDLDVLLTMRTIGPDPRVRERQIVVPSKGREEVTFSTTPYSYSKDTLPGGEFVLTAIAELKRRKGTEVVTRTFEWQLAAGPINQTTKTIIPDKVPNEP